MPKLKEIEGVPEPLTNWEKGKNLPYPQTPKQKEALINMAQGYGQHYKDVGNMELCIDKVKLSNVIAEHFTLIPTDIIIQVKLHKLMIAIAKAFPVKVKEVK